MSWSVESYRRLAARQRRIHHGRHGGAVGAPSVQRQDRRFVVPPHVDRGHPRHAGHLYPAGTQGTEVIRDAAEAALLAGIPKSPGEYAPTERNRLSSERRRNHVLRLMSLRGSLTPSELVRLVATPVRTVEPELGLTRFAHAATVVLSKTIGARVYAAA